MRFYQVNVNFLPELNPEARSGLERIGMGFRGERHGLVHAWVGARSERNALDVARQALEVIEDGDVTIIKPSPEPERRSSGDSRGPKRARRRSRAGR